MKEGRKVKGVNGRRRRTGRELKDNWMSDGGVGEE